MNFVDQFLLTLPEHLLEQLAVVLSLVFVFGIIQNKIWGWPFGIAASVCSTLLFYQELLYSEALLNGFYILAGFYGWFRWSGLLGVKKQKDISEKSKLTHLIILVSGILGTWFMGWFFSKYTRAELPYFDAFSTVFSLFATWLEAEKVLSCWYYWIFINLFSVWLYFQKDLFFYSAFALLLGGMSVWGLSKWKHIMNNKASF
jgi:nicotinamide mononucleotide transporter